MKRKQVNAVMLGLAWMASLGAVFILGILSAFTFHLGPGATDNPAGDLNMDQREMMLVIERYTGRAADISAIMAMGSNESAASQLEQAVRAVLRETDREQRARAAVQIARGLPSRQVMAVIRLLQELPGGPARDQVLGVFLESWATEDGRRAIAFATSLKRAAERELAIQSVLRGWSRIEPSDAWAWVSEQAGSSRRAERWLAIIVSNLGSIDRSTAFLLLEQMPDSVFRNQMAQVVMEQILYSYTPREAINWLGEFPPESRFSAAVILAESWAIYEPEAAVRWMHLSYPRDINGIANVLGEWIYQNPQAAGDWIWRTYSGRERSELLEELALEWMANEGPAPLANWINEHGPHYTLDGAVGRLALQSMNFDPATALIWAQSVIDEDNRSMLEIMIGRQWLRMAPDEAAARLPDLLQSESARGALLESPAPDYYPVNESGYLDELSPLEENTPPTQ